MTSKRKTDSDSLTVKEKRELVARAIANATSVEATKTSGATAAIGASERFPLPGLAFSGDSEELHLPLRLGDTSTRKIKARVTSTMEQPVGAADGPTAATWEVCGAALELRNPRWATFLDESVTAMREKLTIAPAAEIRLSLRKMALVGAGAQLRLDRDSAEVDEEDKMVDGKNSVVFGTFVVALPSTFESAESGVFRLPPDPEATKQRRFWANHAPSPPPRRNVYDLQYAAFYNDSECVVDPVVSGEALFLVYDLVTTTPSEIPLVAGPKRLQQVLNDALSDYFDVVPASLVRRFKLSVDVSRTINEFLTDRRFLYPVIGSSFEELHYRKDRQVADRLAAFCRQSQGQYALYLVTMACVRKKYRGYRYHRTYSVSLHGPCIRHGEARERMFPRSAVRFYDELAHSGFLDTLEYLNQDVDTDADAWKIEDTDWYESDDEDDDTDEYTAKRYSTHALVVQPTTLEHTQWAMGPFKRIIEKLQELADGSPDEALRLVRRVLSTKRNWTPASLGREDLTNEGWSNNHHRFKQMMEVVLVLNDATVFCDLLRNVKAFEYEVENVRRGIQHFGWDSCIAAIESILDDPRSTFRSCVNLVCMALLDVTSKGRVERSEGSRDEALGLVRRALATNGDWRNDCDRFKQMFDIIFAVGDATAFHDLLRSVESFEYEEQRIPRGIQHFGLDSCLAVIGSILDDPRSTFPSRVHLVCMALLNSSNTDHIDLLMNKLAVAVPWAGTHALTDDMASRTFGYEWTRLEDKLTWLFHLAFRSSASTLLELVGHPQAVPSTIYCLVPALVAFAKELSVEDQSLLLPLLRSLRDMVDAAMKDEGPFAWKITGWKSPADEAMELLSSLITA